MVFKQVCPLSGKECTTPGCIDWTPSNKHITLCMFWEDVTTGEHCRLRRAVDTVLTEYDRERERRYYKPDLPYKVR